MNNQVPGVETEAVVEAAPVALASESLVEEISIDGMCGVY
ncbi:mycofactocin precursor [Nocardioides marmoriginsengisoli]|uniref:Mycofactocin n=1 Tax=Nocardioides marmoriginsengisoli TaxID=661483 RepID=A0A3N0CCX7_9ACTN|nr:mycofactocin precursor MftA [Nocardioides marmoriginsengisoli]RNL61310.1 mycofactocin precursor [Nocardioides marmoriginsengisoli]